MRSFTTVLPAALVMLVLAAGAGQAKTITVPATHATVQAAIDAAVNGDVVLVSAGTYKGCLNFKGKSLTLKSYYQSDPGAVAATVLDGDQRGSVVNFTSGEGAAAVLAGFTITNGSGRSVGTVATGYSRGGGIYCFNASPTIRNNLITANDNGRNYGYGGAICVIGGSPVIEANRISGNLQQWRSAIDCTTTTATLQQNIISHNNGAGLRCVESSVSSANNVVSDNGDGVVVEAGVGSFLNDIITFNTAGGLHAAGGATVNVRYCNVYGNAAGNYLGLPNATGLDGNLSVVPNFNDRTSDDYSLKSTGGRWDGAAWVNDTVSSLCIDAGDPASAFSREPAPNGGRVNMGPDGNTPQASLTPASWPLPVQIVQTGVSYRTLQEAIEAAVDGQTVLASRARYKECITFRGKAITVRGTDPTNPTAVGVTVLDGGGGGPVVSFTHGEGSTAVLAGFTITGGGKGLDLAAASPTIRNNVIAHCTRWGLYCVNSSPAVRANTISDNAGGVYCRRGRPVIDGNTIEDNQGTTGGGVYCQAASATIQNNTISGNTAVRGAGLFCSGGVTTVRGNTISDNVAAKEGGVGSGGGVYCTADRTALRNNVIVGNSAGNGGGLYLGGNSTVDSNTIVANTATRGGGVYYAAATAVLRGSIIAFNTGGGGVQAAAATPLPPITYCCLFNNTGGNYLTLADQTGSGGNISANPLFAAAALRDFRLKSKGGRWNPVTEQWVVDTSHSPCIDAGDPAAAFDKEPDPNGGRVNLGFDANTAKASKSRPATAPALLTVSVAAAVARGGLAQLTVYLSAPAAVEARVLTIGGRPVAALPQQQLAAGTSALVFDGRSARGTLLPVGRYLVEVTARDAAGNCARGLAPWQR